MRRRDFLRAGIGCVAWPAAGAIAVSEFELVVPGYELRFPFDAGSHPDFRIEWWYVTGWLDTSPTPYGFQITFFRMRPHAQTSNPSRFAPRHLLFAHAAVSDPSIERLRHEQRSARTGFGLAEAAVGETNVHIDDWVLRRQTDAFAAQIEARDFSLHLHLRPTQPPLLQGDRGYSRKGPSTASASYYYSLPQLRVAGRVRIATRTRDVTGIAWLDHEWSSQIMDAQAVGWDWVGINFDDGAAVMAFIMRDRSGVVRWAAAKRRDAAGVEHTFAPPRITFETLRHWKSPRSGASYPVATRVRVGDMEFELRALMDDQENDTRLSIGAIYWEGAVTALQHGKRIGRGYLELTGYAQPLRF
jgi:predicted secreted hydrolase